MDSNDGKKLFHPGVRDRGRLTGAAQGGRGFTLIEMIIVVLIILVLIGILVPALSYVKKLANNSATGHVLQVIATGVDSYYGDFGMYPPSSGSVGGTPANRGSVLLAEGLEGYLPYSADGAGPGNPQSGAADPAYGFRVNTGGNGKVWGPYVSPDPKLLHVTTAAGTVQYFVDVWGQEILYYRAVPSILNGTPRAITQIFDSASSTPFAGLFAKEDNSAVIDPWTTAPGQSPGVIADPTGGSALKDRPFWQSLGSSQGHNTLSPGDVVVGRDTYLLLSAGYDGKFFTADDVAPPRK